MKKTRLYLLTFAAIVLVAILAGWGALYYYYTGAREALFDQKMESGQREIRELGTLLEQQLQAGILPAVVIENLQKSIVNTDVQSEFVCMYNRQGIELCHPDPLLVGQKIGEKNSRLSGMGNSRAFSDILKSGELRSGIRTFPEGANRSSEVVSVYPVKGTDWMLASHANVRVLKAQLDHLYQQFLAGTFLLILLISAGCFGLMRAIYRQYEQVVDHTIAGLNEEINGLSMLNRQLEAKQQQVVAVERPGEEATRKRLVTYEKDEIITVDVRDIVYISLADNIISAVTFQNRVFVLNSSLDDLMGQLDNEIFYRANRQYIVNINGIENIWIYGRNQLRLSTSPASADPIIISKHKVTEFKKWLDR
ncbi:LytTR family transcriptional regulator DNA-binding domain-containing protein [Chitinophaga varians]|uniref:LytTR family transcriptional regulator DNA-binding domain-containing protein n=1 Tax=Chitinophaga varians TaxID=2202339 RepID=UPI00165FCC0C|nr:LytTR family transcriptional regulator DNA-binding domain-containing protein [Chitinophaga varians]MBC9911104.1 LytTR family transcriptional regulator DNA-binding domain-containing protein [Chitinophaga varians]